MKIAIYHNLPSGGGKRTLHEMTRRLVNKHKVDVFTLSCAEHAFCDLRPYVSTTFIAPFTPWPMLRSPLGRLNQLIRVVNILRFDALDRMLAARIDKESYDLVFVHHCQYRQSPALLRFVKTPTIYYCQEPPRWIYDPPVARPYLQKNGYQSALDMIDPLPRLYRRLLTKADKKNTQAASLVLANSCFTREAILRIYGVNARVCYLGVDTQKFKPLDVERQNRVLSVGALTPLKGFDFLIESLALIPAGMRSALTIIWNSELAGERTYLEHLAQQRGVSAEFLRLVNPGDDNQLVQLYNQAVTALYAPILEPLGLMPLESMACGTPVIGVREGGVRETIIDGVTGMLVERDPKAMADAIQTLLSCLQQAQNLGRQGYEYVRKNWTWESTVTNLERHLEEASSTHSARDVE